MLSPHAKPFVPRHLVERDPLPSHGEGETLPRETGDSRAGKRYLAGALPAEVFVKIFAFLEVAEGARFARTCKYVWGEIWSGKSNNNKLWSYYCERDWRGKYFLEGTIPPLSARNRDTYRRVLLDSRRQCITHDELVRTVFHLRFFSSVGDMANFNNSAARPFPLLLRRFAPRREYWYGKDDPIAGFNARRLARPHFTWTRISRRSLRLDGLPPMLIYRDKQSWAWRIVGPYTQYVSVNLPSEDYEGMMAAEKARGAMVAQGMTARGEEGYDHHAAARFNRMDMIPCDASTFSKLRFTWDTSEFSSVARRLTEEMSSEAGEEDVVAYMVAHADVF